ncbi:hypothetical protein [Chitinophaga qingshengii]|uniref:DUF1795 domain-containing protein n=1 Tax=Chitinophaga qingshengii TaxID=1569794 RepID=A0ABR7TLJ3_9BACT|nr:hypothetical protein [Chitinophaga qingshengii]MBC9930505.1 hypothetical protein [Chitinophaga qingshengii]
MRKKSMFFSLMLGAWATGAMAQTKVNDYLNVPGPMQLDNASYRLVWSTHPRNDYYKQEYLVPGDNLEKFKSLVTIDFLKTNLPVSDLVNQKVEELKKQKAVNPLVNYNLYEKDQQYILDFLISQNSQDGKEIQIVERNVYRYQRNTNQQQPGIVLLAASQRAYGKDIEPFLKKLKTDKMNLVNAVAGYKIPPISAK